VQALLLAGINRRDVLRLMAASAAAGGAAALVPRRFVRAAAQTADPTLQPYGFLTGQEMAILDAATAVIVPTDDTPGARECGVIDYIQRMLSSPIDGDANCDSSVGAADITAIAQRRGPLGDAGCPGADVNGDGVVDDEDERRGVAALFAPTVARTAQVFAGGPFSGRQPQPHFPIGSTPCLSCHGAPAQTGTAVAHARSAKVDVYPPDFFNEFLPMSRLRQLGWTVRLLGASAVPEVSQNPLATNLRLDVDLRRRYRDGLAALDKLSQQQFKMPFVQLAAGDQATVFKGADPVFTQLLTAHTVEGMLCAPEYGGNRNRLGWQLVGFDGDSQPEGYVVYDPSVPGNYRERPDKPNSGPNPDEDCHGFSQGMDKFLTTIVGFLKLTDPYSEKFSNPYCLDLTGPPA
jgi:hypothetical protein